MHTLIRHRLRRTAICIASLFLVAIPLSATQNAAGRLTVKDRGNRLAQDVGQAVVWLETGERHAVTPDTVQVIMSDKTFGPRVAVIPSGTVVWYPNTDGFNHNVFSLSAEGPFDLGLYGRDEQKSTQLNQPGILRVYCNVHARMNSFLVVRDNPFYTQPAADGSFVIAGVPPGQYQIVAWHERGNEIRQPLTMGPGGVSGIALELDASGFEPVAHTNKFGRPYARTGRRY